MIQRAIRACRRFPKVASTVIRLEGDPEVNKRVNARSARRIVAVNALQRQGQARSSEERSVTIEQVFLSDRSRAGPLASS